MPKDRYEDYDSNAANNADVGGVAIQGSSSVALGDNALRELMSHTADHFAADTIASAATTDLGSRAAQHLTVTGTRRRSAAEFANRAAPVALALREFSAGCTDPIRSSSSAASPFRWRRDSSQPA